MTLAGCYCHYQGGIHPLHFLHAIVCHDRVASYPQIVTIECDLLDERRENEIKQKDAEAANKAITGKEEDYRDLLLRIGCSEHDSSNWLGKLREGDRGAMLGISISLLPNMTSLRLFNYSGGYKTPFRQVIDSLSQAEGPHLSEGNLQTMSSIHKQSHEAIKSISETVPLASFLRKHSAFASLSEVQLFDFHGYAYNATSVHQAPDFATLASFARLPTMRTLYAEGLEQNHEFHSWPPGKTVSMVTDFSLTESAVDTSDLLVFIAGLKDLKRLIYEHDSAINPYGPTHSFILALRELTAMSLESLKLIGTWGYIKWDGDTSADRMLRPFGRLRDAVLPIELFFNVYNMGRANARLEIDKAEGFITPIADVLPASIRRIRIHGNVKMHTVGLLLEGLTSKKAIRLPNIKCIAFNRCIVEDGAECPMGQKPQLDPAVKEWKDTCQASGVTLLLGQSEYDRHYTSYESLL
ncbi:MAG: hypothetical protein Q9164_001017 [Protoblastenia rupestris]